MLFGTRVNAKFPLTRLPVCLVLNSVHELLTLFIITHKLSLFMIADLQFKHILRLIAMAFNLGHLKTIQEPVFHSIL